MPDAHSEYLDVVDRRRNRAAGGTDRASVSRPRRRDRAAASVTAHLDAGADHVVVQVLGDGNPRWDPRPSLRELAGALGLVSA